MSKYTITLTKSEIEVAVLSYINREVTICGRKELKDPVISFRDKDGSVGYFEVDIESSGPASAKEIKGDS